MRRVADVRSFAKTMVAPIMTNATRALRAADERRFEIEALVAALSSQHTVVTGPKQVVRRAQLDTLDRRLRTAGLTLKHQIVALGGRPANFSTTDRYADLPGGLVRAEWTTPIDGWAADGDRFMFTRGSAIWQLPEGPLHYLDFRMPRVASATTSHPRTSCPHPGSRRRSGSEHGCS